MTTLVTGGLGCIGAWTLYHLHERGEPAVCFDLSDDRHRLDLLLDDAQQAEISFVQGDINDYAQVQHVIEAYGVTHVIHLAALQVPGCRANPVLGARVNVTGTTNVFEAARQAGLLHIAYASSIAVYGPPSAYPPGLLAPDAPMLPDTLYGVYKVANEGTARIFWQDHGISSVTLRPYTVYGLGRDQGLTSEPTRAMQAAARGEDYAISFGGRMQFHFASDMAQQFIDAAHIRRNGALGFNMGTPPIDVQAVADLIMEVVPGVSITVGAGRVPFPEACDPAPLHAAFDTVYETPLREGITRTIEGFRRLSTG